jgi:hypothetical protein
VITRLLVNKLHLPEAILNQWTKFELSLFVIQIRCPVSVLSPPLFLSDSSRRVKCEKRNLYDWPNTTAPQSSYALTILNTPFAEPAIVPWLLGVDTDLVEMKALESLAQERKWVRCPKPSKSTLIFAPLWLHFIPGSSDCGIMVEKGKRSQDYVDCRCGA